MKLSLLKSTAIAAVLSAGLATGAVAADSAKSTNAQATSGAQTQVTGQMSGTTLDSTAVIDSRVMAADNQELGRVINVYQAPETADPFIIVDRGASFAAESRYVPIRTDSLQMTGDRMLVVRTTAAEFDQAPAYSATGINEVEMWPPRIQEFWHDKYAADEPISVTVSEAVNVRPRDLSQNAPGYQAPGATPGAGAGPGQGSGAAGAAASPGAAAGAAGDAGGAGAAGSGAAGTQ